MNESPPKKEIVLVVTQDTTFSLNTLFSTYKTIKDDDNYRITIDLNIKIRNILCIEYDQCHIYFCREGANYYVNLDFNLMPDKKQLSKCIFDQLQEILKKYKRDNQGMYGYDGDPDFVTYRLFTTDKKTDKTVVNLLTRMYNDDQQ